MAEAKKAVDWYVAYGHHQLKIHNSFPSAILRETVAYAHSRSMRVSGHVPAFMRAQEVVEQVYDEIQHITQVMLNFLVKPDTDTQTLERFYLADLVLVDGDPTRQIADIRKVALVMTRGYLIDPAKVYTAPGVKTFFISWVPKVTVAKGPRTPDRGGIGHSHGRYTDNLSLRAQCQGQ